MAEFDLKRLTPLEWAGAGGGALAFIVSFFPWFSVDAGMLGGSTNAWGTEAWSVFAVLLLMAAGGLVLSPHFGMKVDRLPLIWVILAGLATLFVLIQWLRLPDDESGFGVTVDMGAGFGLIVGLLLAIVSTVAGVLTLLAAPKHAPGGANPAAA